MKTFTARSTRGTDAGEVFTAPPPPPSPYARGPYNRTGLGEIMVRRGPNGAVAYIGCNTGGQPCGLTLLEGFVKALHDLPEPTLGDCWAQADRPLLCRRTSRDHQAQRRLVPSQHFLPGHEIHGLRRPGLEIARPREVTPLPCRGTSPGVDLLREEQSE